LLVGGSAGRNQTDHWTARQIILHKEAKDGHDRIVSRALEIYISYPEKLLHVN